MKDKSHMTISIDRQETFSKALHPFLTKTLDGLGKEGMLLDIIEAIYEKFMANVIINEEKLKAFPVRCSTRKECTLSPLLFNILLEVLERSNEKKHPNHKGRCKMISTFTKACKNQCLMDQSTFGPYVLAQSDACALSTLHNRLMV